MSTNYIYDEILNQAQRLTTDQQLRLLEELAAFIRQKVTTEPLHSVLEFEGMVKELWQGVDVEKYIDDERNSWER